MLGGWYVKPIRRMRACKPYWGEISNLSTIDSSQKVTYIGDSILINCTTAIVLMSHNLAYLQVLHDLLCTNRMHWMPWWRYVVISLTLPALELPCQCSLVKIISALQLSADFLGTPRNPCPFQSSKVHRDQHNVEKSWQNIRCLSPFQTQTSTPQPITR